MIIQETSVFWARSTGRVRGLMLLSFYRFFSEAYFQASNRLVGSLNLNFRYLAKRHLAGSGPLDAFQAIEDSCFQIMVKRTFPVSRNSTK